MLVHNQSSCPYSPLLYKSRLCSSFSFNNSQVFALVFAKLKGSAVVPPQQTNLLITNLCPRFKSNKLRFVPCPFTVKNSLFYLLHNTQTLSWVLELLISSSVLNTAMWYQFTNNNVFYIIHLCHTRSYYS